MTGVTDQDEQAYTWDYDGASRVKNSTDPLGYQLSYEWDKSNNLIEETGTNTGTVAYQYRSDNKLRAVTLPDGNTLYFTTMKMVAYSKFSIRGRMSRKRSFIKGMVGVLRYKISNFLIKTIITIVIMPTGLSPKLPLGLVWMSILMTTLAG